MADEKKFTAHEAAFAVLAKAQELLAKTELAKGATGSELNQRGVHREVGGRSDSGMSVAGSHARDAKEGLRPNYSASKDAHKEKLSELKAMPKPSLPKSEMDKCGEMSMGKFEGEDPKKENEIGTKFVKAENPKAPSNSMDPKTKEAPDSSNPPNKVQSQPNPTVNPKEIDDNNNPPSGATPSSMAVPGNGIMKLFHFCGHVKSKNKKKVI